MGQSSRRWVSELGSLSSTHPYNQENSPKLMFKSQRAVNTPFLSCSWPHFVPIPCSLKSPPTFSSLQFHTPSWLCPWVLCSSSPNPQPLCSQPMTSLLLPGCPCHGHPASGFLAWPQNPLSWARADLEGLVQRPGVHPLPAIQGFPMRTKVGMKDTYLKKKNNK